MSNEQQWTSLEGKTPEELKQIIHTLRGEVSKLRTERNEQAEDMAKHVQRFHELRESFAMLSQQVNDLVKRKKS
jgi:hypothetical protein